MGVAVGCNEAKAVSKACVYTALTSGVGAETEGAHEVNSTASRLIVRKRRDVILLKSMSNPYYVIRITH
jgi:hypothetical protein